MMHQEAQLSNFMEHPEPVRVALEKYFKMVAEYCRGLPWNTGEERREKKSLHTSAPLKRKGKKFREEAEILVYKGRANHNAD
jgi:hypothetical protein